MPEQVDSPPAGVRAPGPWRTCVGCRQRCARRELLRVVAIEGACVPDPRGRLPGRGAHVHPRAGCLDLAERRRAFPRALRVHGPLDVGPLRAWIDQCPSVPSGGPLPLPTVDDDREHHG